MTGSRTSVGRVIFIIALAIAAFIVAAIVLIALSANEDNMIVNAIVELGRFFATPFDEMFPQSNHEASIALNWGIGAAAYLFVGALFRRVLH